MAARSQAVARLLRLWVRIPPGGIDILSLVIVVCCQVQVSGSGWSLIHRSPTECGVSECDLETTIVRSPWPNGGSCGRRKKGNFVTIIYSSNSLTMWLFFIVSSNVWFASFHISVRLKKIHPYPTAFPYGNATFLTTAKHRLSCGHLNFLRPFKYSQNRTRRDLES